MAALLLERLDSQRTLNDVALGEAVSIAGSLLRRLAVVPPRGIESLEERSESWVESWSKSFDACNRPFPNRWLDAAIHTCRQLAPSADRLLVNEDLHFGNVLAGVREPWSVIDPKVVVGDLEFGAASVFWNRGEEGRFEERLDVIVQAAGLDDEKTRAWLQLRVIDFWLWALPLGFTQYARTCEELAGWLAS